MNEQLSHWLKMEPYCAAIEGWNAYPDDPAWIGAFGWPNTVSISVVTGWGAPSLDDNDVYADAGGQRELVEIDTNYKHTRPGEYPVRLTRTAAIKLAGHVLKAAEDTFHYGRVGRLRATEAAELLQALDHVQATLQTFVNTPCKTCSTTPASRNSLPVPQTIRSSCQPMGEKMHSTTVKGGHSALRRRHG